MIAYLIASALALASADSANLTHDFASETRPPAKRAMPRGGLLPLFKHEDYPNLALQRREEGTVVFDIGVDARGKVTSCTIIESSGSEALDKTSCDLTRTRANFVPARDDHGRAVADTIRQRVRWNLPGHNSPDESVAYWRATVGADAKPTGCRVMVGGKAKSEDCAFVWPVVEAAWAMMGGGPLPANATVGFAEQSQGIPGGEVSEKTEDDGIVLAFDAKRVTFAKDGTIASCEFIRLKPLNAKRRCFVPGGFKIAVGPNGPIIPSMRFGRTLWYR